MRLETKSAHIAANSRYVRRSQNKAQGERAGVKGQNIPRVRKKPLTFFKAHPQPRPSSVSAPVPCAPMCCFFSSPVGPGCITPRPQSEPNRLCVSKVSNDVVMMPKGVEIHTGVSILSFSPHSAQSLFNMFLLDSRISERVFTP